MSTLSLPSALCRMSSSNLFLIYMTLYSPARSKRSARKKLGRSFPRPSRNPEYPTVSLSGSAYRRRPTLFRRRPRLIAVQLTDEKETKQFTEEEIKNIVDLWPYHSISEISKLTKRYYYSILYLADRIREDGYDLPRKNSQGDA